jgi:predicted amidohydrolase
LKARAIENQVYVIGANCGGKRWGNSLIVDPWGEVVAKAGNQSEVIMAEIDLDVVKEVREKYPFLRDLDRLL